MTAHRDRALVAGLLALLIAGCATAPPPVQPLPLPVPPPETASTRPYPRPEEPAPPVPLAPERSGVARALDFLAQARLRPPRDQRMEYESVRKSYALSRSEHDRVKLALLLSLPNAPFGDDNQALELLEPLARDAGSEYHGLAQLVIALLNEQRRLGKQATALQQKLDRLRALEKEMQQRAVNPESKKR